MHRRSMALGDGRKRAGYGFWLHPDEKEGWIAGVTRPGEK